MTVISFEDFRNERRLVYLDLGNVFSLHGEGKLAAAARRPLPSHPGISANGVIETSTRAMAELPLTDKELAFVFDMHVRAVQHGNRFHMTERQHSWFRSIADRLDNAIQA